MLIKAIIDALARTNEQDESSEWNTTAWCVTRAYERTNIRLLVGSTMLLPLPLRAVDDELR